MFFILGMPRSGTTLLASILNQHDEIIIPDETDFIVPMAFIWDRIKDLDHGRRLISEIIVSTDRYQASIGEYLSKGEVHTIINDCKYEPSAILDEIYNAIAIKACKRISGDKSPNDIKFFSILNYAGLMNNRKVVHIVRDPRDVYSSLIEHNMPSGRNFMHNWVNANMGVDNWFRQVPEQYYLVRYEDFVSDPEEMIYHITEFLGAKFQPTMLYDDQRGARYKNARHHQKLFEPISEKSIGRWRNDLSSTTKEMFQGYEDVFRHYGYEV
jgi:hypothetical protein